TEQNVPLNHQQLESTDSCFSLGCAAIPFLPLLSIPAALSPAGLAVREWCGRSSAGQRTMALALALHYSFVPTSAMHVHVAVVPQAHGASAAHLLPPLPRLT